jgi:hypothetical protein
MKIQTHNGRHAFTLFEGFVIGAVLLLLLAAFLPALSTSHHCALKANCVNNLRQMGIAFRIWEGDHGDEYPMNLSVSAGGAREFAASGNVVACFQVMSNELVAPQLLICPDDSRRRAATNFETLKPFNLSYFVALNASEDDPEVFLSGDANLVLRGRPVPASILNPWTNSTTWTSDRHHGAGNVLVADGSVQSVTRFGTASPAGTTIDTNCIVVP